MDGNAFVLLRGTARVGEGNDNGGGNDVDEIVWHISAMYLSPYRPTFQAMKILETNGTVYFLEAQVRFMTEYDAYAELDISGKLWTFTVLRLMGGDRPVGTFDPKRVSAHRVLPGPCAHEWALNPRRSRPPRRNTASGSRNSGHAGAGVPGALALADGQVEDAPVEDAGSDSDTSQGRGDDAAPEATTPVDLAEDTAVFVSWGPNIWS